VVDGIPNLHPCIAAAHGIARWMKRPRSFAWMLGATGEAFTTAYSLERPEAALRHTAGNTFLAALAISGILGRAAHGGPFEPAIGGVEVTLGRDLVPILATRHGPALVRDVNMDAGTVDWIRPGEERTTVPFAEVEEEWSEGWWPAGEVPFLRVTLELAEDRAAALVANPAIEAMVMLVTQDVKEPYRTGAAAWEAFADDLREDRIAGDAADVIVGELLPKLAVARLGAVGFLEEVASAVPESRREGVEAARRKFAEIHTPSIVGEVFGTGLLPEAADCLLEDQLPDPGRLADPAFRERAADLLLEVRDREIEAADLVREAFDRP
jgi:hypothetical protein